jgi:hypothetical protein
MLSLNSFVLSLLIVVSDRIVIEYISISDPVYVGIYGINGWMRPKNQKVVV